MVTGTDYQTVGVAVPIRCNGTESQQQSTLAGLRVAVKDVFRLEGMKTSLCNRAYLAVSEPAKQTSPVVAALVGAGAHLIGLTKLSSFASREEPTEGVDYQVAFNPRGEGYQSPAGSSSGSAVAIAAYDWVDVSIGTDTSGSGRRPALVNGVFQLRPSHDLVPLDGIVPTFKAWDTPCLYGRDLDHFSNIVSLWHSLQESSSKKGAGRKSAIYYPEDYFPVANEVQMSIIEGFMLDLSKLLEVPISRVSIASLWGAHPPPEADGESVQDYLRDTAVNTYYQDFYHSTDEFRGKYQARYLKDPYATPFNHWRWNLGSQVTRAQYEDGLHRLSVYKEWFLNTVMRNQEYQSLVLLPVANVSPNYRDIPPPRPMIQEGFDQLFLPPILGSPDLFVPLGDFQYHSRVSQREEYLPIGVDVVGSPGSDLWLIDIIQRCLKSSRRPDRVQTGPRVFL